MTSTEMSEDSVIQQRAADGKRFWRRLNKCHDNANQKQSKWFLVLARRLEQFLQSVIDFSVPTVQEIVVAAEKIYLNSCA